MPDEIVFEVTDARAVRAVEIGLDEAGPRVKKTTYRAYRSAIVHHINPRIGGVAIGKLKPQTQQHVPAAAG